MNILEYLDSKHISYKISGDEAITLCPDCHKEKLYLNIKSGVFHCFHCETVNPESKYAKGHISQLKEEYGDIVPISSVADRIGYEEKEDPDFTDQVNRYHYNLLQNKNALRYLIKDRGFSQEIIEKLKLGFIKQYNQEWISIPSFEDGIPKLIKYRKLPPSTNEELAKYIREKDSKSILFNGDVIDQYDELVLTEGEICCATLLDNGYDNVIGITGGCGTLRPEWYDRLILKNKLFMVFDTDDDGQGQKAARDIWATRLGLDRCYNVLLPKGHDVNSFFKDHTKEDFQKYLLSAKTFKVKGVLSLQESLYEMYKKSLNEEDKDVIPFPWESLNKLTGGGMRKKRLYVLGGAPGVGKTSGAVQIMYHLAKNYNIPGMLFCMEMPEVSLASKIVQLELDLTYKEIDYADAMIYADTIGELPIYFAYSSKVTPEVFYNTAEEVRNRYGVQFFIFDNLQRLVRSDKESDIGKASAIFKDISMDLDSIMMLVSQPRKLNNATYMTYDDLKGSSAIPADADSIILLFRKRILTETGADYLDPITSFTVDKERFATGGKTHLKIIGDKSKFIEVEE